MVSFSEKWNVLKNKETLSQKFMGTVKPDAPLKNRLDVAQKRLQQQIVKLGETEQKLKQKDSQTRFFKLSSKYRKAKIL